MSSCSYRWRLRATWGSLWDGKLPSKVRNLKYKFKADAQKMEMEDRRTRRWEWPWKRWDWARRNMKGNRTGEGGILYLAAFHIMKLVEHTHTPQWLFPCVKSYSFVHMSLWPVFPICLQSRSITTQSQGLATCIQLLQKLRVWFSMDMDFLSQDHFKKCTHFWKKGAGQSCPRCIRVISNSFAKCLEGSWFVLYYEFLVPRRVQRIRGENIVLVAISKWQREPSHPLWIYCCQPFKGHP